MRSNYRCTKGKQLPEKESHKISLLSDDDKLIIDKIESFVMDVSKGLDAKHINVIQKIEMIPRVQKSLDNNKSKLLERSKIISTLLEEESVIESHALYELKPFSNLNNGNGSHLCLRDILRLPVQCSREMMLQSLNEYFMDINSQINSIHRKMGDLINLNATLNNQLIDPEFDATNRYLNFKKQHNLYFEIDQNCRLLKISRKGAGPRFSVLYSHDGKKTVLDSRERRYLGVGGFARVKMSQDYDTHALYALKIQSTTRNNRPCLGELSQEVTNLSSVGMLHSFVVMQSRKKHYIAMPLISGRDLFVIINDTSTSPTKIFNIMLLCALEVQRLHDKNMIHRDIKFENFVYDEANDVCKLIDFAFLIHVNGDAVVSDPKFLGTAEYMAPEINQALSCRSLVCAYSKRSDIYAFGVMLSELASTLPPQIQLIAKEFMKPLAERPLTLNPFIDTVNNYFSTPFTSPDASPHASPRNSIDNMHKRPRLSMC